MRSARSPSTATSTKKVGDGFRGSSTPRHPLAGRDLPIQRQKAVARSPAKSLHTGLDTPSLAIELLCEPEPFQPSTSAATGSLQHCGRVELNSATVTITDEQPPQITSTSGSLFTGGLVRGTISGTIDGSDNSGVQSARLYVDGAQVAQQALACDFTRPAPCPAGSSNQFSLNTTTLANGPHQIQAAVVDAAGNQTLAGPVQITVENTAPIAPIALSRRSRLPRRRPSPLASPRRRARGCRSAA